MKDLPEILQTKDLLDSSFAALFQNDKGFRHTLSETIFRCYCHPEPFPARSEGIGEGSLRFFIRRSLLEKQLIVILSSEAPKDLL